MIATVPRKRVHGALSRGVPSPSLAELPTFDVRIVIGRGGCFKYGKTLMFLRLNVLLSQEVYPNKSYIAHGTFAVSEVERGGNFKAPVDRPG